MSDHFLLEAKVRVAGRRAEGEHKVVKVWKINEVEKRCEYEEKMRLN
jgi:hypothetical protein